MYYLSLVKLNRLRFKYGMKVRLNSCGKGLCIVHLGSIITNGDVGEDARLFVNSAIVKGKDENEKYFIILSPPCDLALHKGKFKSDRILLCEIDSYDDLNKNLISKATNSKDKQKRIEEIIQNNRTRYYHWLPRNLLFEGRFINFRKVSSYSQEDFNEKFMKPKLKVQEAFVKNILNRFSSFYGRQGQPDFDFTNELKTNKDIFRKL